MPQIDIVNHLKLAEKVARKTGAFLLEHWNQENKVDSAIGRDIKLEVDRLSNDIVLEGLQSQSSLPLLSEEVPDDRNFFELDSPYWVVDPLDGTYNFFRGFPSCCVSIALWEKKEPLLGVLYDFTRDEIYTATRSQGLRVNGIARSVSDVNDLKQAALATGFPMAQDFSDGSMQRFFENSRKFKKIRMMGSAAMSLATVAIGQFDCYLEEYIAFWDVAAGLALVKFGGGQIEFESLPQPYRMRVMAKNSHL